MPLSERQKQDLARYREKRVKAGYRQVVFWTTPEQRQRLKDLAEVHGSAQKAFEALLGKE